MKNKCLTLTGLEYFLNKLRIASAPTETNYWVELQENIEYSFTIPGYEKNKSLVDVYVNNLRMAVGQQYTLSDTGIIKLSFNVHGLDNHIHVVHRKWS